MGGGLDDYFAQRNTQIPAVLNSQQVFNLLSDSYFSMLIGKIDFEFIETHVKRLRRNKETDWLDLDDTNLDDLVRLTITRVDSL